MEGWAWTGQDVKSKRGTLQRQPQTLAPEPMLICVQRSAQALVSSRYYV